MDISTDQQAINAIETLKHYLTQAQKCIEDRQYKAAKSYLKITLEDLPHIIHLLP